MLRDAVQPPGRIPLRRTGRCRARGTAERGEDGDQRRELLRCRVALDDPQQRALGTVGRRLGHQSGMFPCFLLGRISRFEASRRNAFTISIRVSWGGMTPSTYPRSAARYGLASVSSYSVTSCARVASGSAASFSSLRYRMLTAPWAPITAICAVGQATLMSAPRCLDPITS